MKYKDTSSSLDNEAVFTGCKSECTETILYKILKKICQIRRVSVISNQEEFKIYCKLKS